MIGDDDPSGSNVTAQHVGLLVFGLLATLFSLIPETRPLVFVTLWVGAPVVAFGTLGQVLRGTYELRSGRGIIFAMACGVLTVVAIPLGFAIVAETIADALAFLGFVTALVTVGVARLAVTEPTPGPERDIPTPEELAEYEDFDAVLAEHGAADDENGTKPVAPTEGDQSHDG